MTTREKLATMAAHPRGFGAFSLPRFNPWKLAGGIAVAYLVLGVAYIYLSTLLAGQYAATIEEMKHIETIKGIAFIATMAALLFVSIGSIFKRIAYKERICAHQREALILSENRALAGVFASSVAHDINNVLTILNLVVEELAASRNESKAHNEQVGELRRTCERIGELTARLVTSSRPEHADRFERMDLYQVIGETVDLARTHQRVRDCTLELDGKPSVYIAGNNVLIHQMILNLVINAAEACGPQGHIKVRIFSDNKHRIIEVHDNGPGVPEDERESVFTPFFTTKSDGKGLGLLSVKACAKAHHGDVSIDDSPMGGACFRIHLPLEPDVESNAA